MVTVKIPHCKFEAHLLDYESSESSPFQTSEISLPDLL